MHRKKNVVNKNKGNGKSILEVLKWGWYSRRTFRILRELSHPPITMPLRFAANNTMIHSALYELGIWRRAKRQALDRYRSGTKEPTRLGIATVAIMVFAVTDIITVETALQQVTRTIFQNSDLYMRKVRFWFYLDSLCICILLLLM